MRRLSAASDRRKCRRRGRGDATAAARHECRRQRPVCWCDPLFEQLVGLGIGPERQLRPVGAEGNTGDFFRVSLEDTTLGLRFV